MDNKWIIIEGRQPIASPFRLHHYLITFPAIFGVGSDDRYQLKGDDVFVHSCIDRAFLKCWISL